jgi:hypothetical protein
VLATPTRGGRRQVIICGRKHCGVCSRFRHVSDFAVKDWADVEKTRPRIYYPRCRVCGQRAKKKMRDSRRRVEEHVDPRIADRRRANAFVRAMPKESRLQYELEGALPFAVASIADEDYDPTPVPQGCPSCYLRGGIECDRCPDPNVKEHRREARAQGIILP